MIVSIEHSKTHNKYKYTINVYNNALQCSNIYSNQINSINLHTSFFLKEDFITKSTKHNTKNYNYLHNRFTQSFDNASHDDKQSRISHNSITLCHELQVMFNWLFSLTLPSIDGWYLSTNFNLTIHIYKRDNYNLMIKLSF